MSIEASKLVKEVLQDLAHSTRTSYLITLNRFVNEFIRDKQLDDLVHEAKTSRFHRNYRLVLYESS